MTSAARRERTAWPRRIASAVHIQAGCGVCRISVCGRCGCRVGSATVWLRPAELGLSAREGVGVRRLLLAVTVLAALGVAGWYGLHWVPADFSYGLETEFATVPPDDEALAAWIRSQPGVYSAHVQRVRAGNSWRLEVIFGITRNGWGQPPLPALDAAAAEFGYRDAAGPFRDSPLE